MTRVAYIGGLGRSGSTLLETVLGGFPDVCALGEVVHLWTRGVAENERCSCGSPFSECEFWQAVGAEAFGGWTNLDVGVVADLAAEVDRTRQIPADLTARSAGRRRATMERYGSYYRAVYAAAATVSGTRVVVDSSKHASTAFVLRRTADIDLRVLHSLRDSRGVAHSWGKSVQRPEAEAGSAHAMMARWSPSRTAVYWNTTNLAFDVLARSGVPVLRAPYERLVAQPLRQVGEVADFLGLDRSVIPGFVSTTSVSPSRSHQISGNPIRFGTGPMTLRLDEAWRTEMAPGTQRLVTLLTAPQLASYGYLGRRGTEGPDFGSTASVGI